MIESTCFFQTPRGQIQKSRMQQGSGVKRPPTGDGRVVVVEGGYVCGSTGGSQSATERRKQSSVFEVCAMGKERLCLLFVFVRIDPAVAMTNLGLLALRFREKKNYDTSAALGFHSCSFVRKIID